MSNSTAAPTQATLALPAPNRLSLADHTPAGALGQEQQEHQTPTPTAGKPLQPPPAARTKGPAPSSSSSSSKPQRILACVLCQQRKVKCDRKFPCANCVRAGVHCVPANTLGPRPRRRRFPERELLGRLGHYESLLQQHNIRFEPLHPPAPNSVSASASASASAEHHAGGRASSGSVVSGDDHHAHSEVTGENSKEVGKSKDAVDLWQAISRVTLDPEDDEEDDDSEGDGIDDDDPSVNFFTDSQNRHRRHRDAVVKQAWAKRFQKDGSEQSSSPANSPASNRSDDQANDHLLFGSSGANVDLSVLHPGQAQIFRLWQVYLDNVNPLLKITHTPTLQSRIIDAASDITNISPSFEALMFSIYCISTVSLAEDQCRALFHSPKKDLLSGFQSACQQALRKCSAWRSSDLDGVTALYIYLVSVRPQTDPRSLSCMLGIAIRIAQRLGMHSEASYANLTALEGEMRRRLWWSLVIFDHRICELSDYKTTTLLPTWDCRTPRNINDFEIRSNKSTPAIHGYPTEALFAVVRSEVADFIRHSAFHLNFVNPRLNSLAQPKTTPADTDSEPPSLPPSELLALERLIEDKHLAFCNTLDPLHFMTIWTTRSTLARNRLMEHYSRHSTLTLRPTDAQRLAAVSYALRMLESDTTLRTSPLARGYLWFVDFHFPALAYLHLLNGLRKRPGEDHATTAWEVMSENYAALAARPRANADEQGGVDRIFVAFSRVVFQAWEAREALIREKGGMAEAVPGIVQGLRNKMASMCGDVGGSGFGFAGEEQGAGGGMGSGGSDGSGANTNMVSNMPMEVGGSGGGQSFAGMAPGGVGYYPEMPGQAGMMDVDMDQFWTEMDWRLMNTQGQ
ncbi:fungal-specific transcription factor domain-containing protein [Podospora appendiculata]|uniref:Fungal-specific transcription factor domain-containing protein n=1 Tax=Podospora appendiculata TaxID=314037 RepID=A0AAE0WZJ5_9PEZI|nr:fungal-specific transcription factor domain-containing protein [Podospora appendiculata]